VACLCFEPAGQGLAGQLEQSASPHFAGKKTSFSIDSHSNVGMHSE